MEVTGSTVAGAMRVGLQIVSAHKQPKLEIYAEVLNRFGPEHDIPSPLDKTTQRYRFQDINFQLRLVNIGGQRAERVRLLRSGTFERRDPRDFGGLFDTEIPQLAPGQVLQLCLFDQHELMSDNEPDAELVIEISYYSPAGFMNFLRTLWSRILRRPHHRETFRITPRMFWGDLPPPTYS
ncbi:hypothetical protein [Sphingopyxis sp. GC21]|uniref:hypothetical protein n=1 Tax=Sphingopyxis sp. GC21 TaxID=2933562 RepID=UPI0021E43840|nr:hypothetical protein [Sphingopyxis sp. GC21]